MEILSAFQSIDCLAIIGMEKNTGKTTVLNYLINSLNQNYRLGITSIGYDGETVDQVTKTSKPQIYIRAGTLVATARGLLTRCDFTRELLAFTGFNTPMGEVIITRALSDGLAEIAGPSIIQQMNQLVDLLKQLGADKILIDGAAARKSSAAVVAAEGCILTTGAAFSGNLTEIIEKTSYYASLLSTSRIKFDTSLAVENRILIQKLNQTISRGGDPLEIETADEISARLDQIEAIYFPGAVTATFLSRLTAKNQNLNQLTIIAENATRFLFNSKQYQAIIKRGGKFGVIHPIDLIAVAVNPVFPGGKARLNSQQIMESLSINLNLPIIDVVRNNLL